MQIIKLLLIAILASLITSQISASLDDTLGGGIGTDRP